MTINQKKETMNKIFKMLDEECQPHSTPISHKTSDLLFAMKEMESLGVFMRMFSKCFDLMRETGGKSKWTTDVSFFLTDEVGEKNILKKDDLLTLLSKFKKLNLIKEFIEDGSLIPVQFDVEFMFDMED